MIGIMSPEKKMFWYDTHQICQQNHRHVWHDKSISCLSNEQQCIDLINHWLPWNDAVVIYNTQGEHACIWLGVYYLIVMGGKSCPFYMQGGGMFYFQCQNICYSSLSKEFVHAFAFEDIFSLFNYAGIDNNNIFIYLNSMSTINATIMMFVKVSHNSSKNGQLICILLNAFYENGERL